MIRSRCWKTAAGKRLKKDRLGASSILALALVVVSSGAAAQSIQVGTSTGTAGATAEISVSVSTPQELSGVNFRLHYDSTAFGAPFVAKGSLLSDSHLLEFHSPADGELNVVVFVPAGSAPIPSGEGVLAKIRFQVEEEAGQGNHPIAFSDQVPGPPLFPPSGFSGSNGTSVAHSRQPGEIILGNIAAGDTDGNERVDGLDVFFFSANWGQEPTPMTQRANAVTGTGHDLIDVRDLLVHWIYWID